MRKYDVIVIGAGHAGIEAALSSARLGHETLLCTISLDSLALMPCNPSIGGTGKGHLVREIDALGGEMGLAADRATIQSKMLNTAKGPAVHSLRIQADKYDYQVAMKQVIEDQQRLDLLQAEVIDFIIHEDELVGVKTNTGIDYEASVIILATGTYLKSVIFMGEQLSHMGPNGLKSSDLSDTLRAMGMKLRRFKTGTPPRIHKDSIDFSKLGLHPGDEKIEGFSFLNEDLEVDQVDCYLGYTNEASHEIILKNLHLSGLYTGTIKGVGARYCPSIETKLERFSDKERHQFFLEPEGLRTKEYYMQGMSTSLPVRVQEEFLKTIPGLENAKIMRPGYAIEYDCLDPTELTLSLSHKTYKNLFFAGQINGSSGYEEAAAQGLIAGINAHQYLLGEDPLILRRDQAYIGVLIDDLVTKGTDEPFRMMTSRCEYRLILRQDNADQRLTPIGRELGLVSDERWAFFTEKVEQIEAEKKRIKKVKIHPETVNGILQEQGGSIITEATSLESLLRRGEITYANTEAIDSERPPLRESVKQAVEIEIKYEGYIQKQLRQIESFKNLELKKIDPQTDYETIKGLRLEAIQKLKELRPLNLGQASRISGVNPADVQVLLVYLENLRRRS